MLKVTELAFSCYAVTDMTRARQFYEGVLGLNPTTIIGTRTMQWVEYEFGPYALSHRLRARNVQAQSGRLLRRARGRGFRRRHSATPRDTTSSSASNRCRLPVCHMAMVFDPDGNTFAFTSEMLVIKVMFEFT